MIEVKVPMLAESVTEATILEWAQKVGDSVKRGDRLVDLETDKVMLEITAPCDGKLLEIIKQNSTTVTSEEIIATIDEAAAPSELTVPDATSDNTIEDNSEKKAEKNIKLSPAVRTILAENQLKATDITTKQQSDRLTKADILDHLATAINNTDFTTIAEHGPAEQQTSPEQPDIPVATDTEAVSTPQDHSTQQTNPEQPDIPAATDTEAVATPQDQVTSMTPPEHSTQQTNPEQPDIPAATDTEAVATPQDQVTSMTPPEHSTQQTPQTSPSSVNIDQQRPERRVAMTQLRKRVAERLLSAQNEYALLTTFNEVNMRNVIDLRQRHKQHFEEVHGVKLGFMSFFALATVAALKRFPIINAMIEGTDIIYRDYFDIGIAISAKRGLLVPILRDADQLSPATIELKIKQYSEKANNGKLTIAELTGGTFTITNGGVFGSLLSTPIVNPPQSAILGMHAIQQRPIVENDQITICPMMYLALSYDHRIIDGSDAVKFLVSIKESIEEPSRLLLDI